jgi:hypothetical protein
MLSSRFTTTNVLKRSLAYPHSRTLISSSRNMAPPTPWTPGQYPPVRRSDFKETFKSAKQGEVEVADPYQWLHDPDSKETQEFVKAQGEFTRKYLEKYTDREMYSTELKRNWDYPRCTLFLLFFFPLLHD